MLLTQCLIWLQIRCFVSLITTLYLHSWSKCIDLKQKLWCSYSAVDLRSIYTLPFIVPAWTLLAAQYVGLHCSVCWNNNCYPSLRIPFGPVVSVLVLHALNTYFSGCLLLFMSSVIFRNKGLASLKKQTKKMQTINICKIHTASYLSPCQLNY